jgi:hypothetical protein
MTVAWPGEQLALYDAIVEAGPLDPYGDLYYALGVQEAADTTVTVNAGDQFYLYSDAPRLTTADDPLGECNWIIDVTAGSATVSVETGFDVDWSYNPPFTWAPTGISTLATGRAVVPLPTEDRSLPRLVDVGAPLLRITVTSGTATLRAAWLQVEPPDGLKVMDGWTWSDWITPELVPAKANIGGANAGAGVTINDSTDANGALDTVREGGATRGASLDSNPASPPYSYTQSAETDGDLFSNANSATAYDRSGVLETTPPSSFASLNVGYSMGYWRERPTLRQTPDAMLGLKAGRDYVPIDTSTFTWPRYVEFQDGTTTAVSWADVWLNITVPAGAALDLTMHVGYSTGILLTPPPPGEYGSFGTWPPPLGTELITLEAPSDPLPIPTPPPGSDWTLVAYSDLALDAYSPDENTHGFEIRPYSREVGTALFIWHQMPDYRYRVPNFVPSPDAVGAKPRFFVKDIDGAWHPVGFGKPTTTETAVFRVATAEGPYRDLTGAEYAALAAGQRPAGAYPLKVKREGDPEWWDHVAWLVPAQ